MDESWLFEVLLTSNQRRMIFFVYEKVLVVSIFFKWVSDFVGKNKAYLRPDRFQKTLKMWPKNGQILAV